MMKLVALLALVGCSIAEVAFLQNAKVHLKGKHVNSMNPFIGKVVYPNPTFTSNVQKTETDHPDMAAALKKTENIGAATWIDSMAHIAKIEPVLKGAQQTGQVPMFVIYDLPNRDCSALASNGEIVCK